MTRPFHMPRFFLTTPTPCPYLPGRQERKIFTRLSGDDPTELHDTLAELGFRRSQNIAYRPACDGCTACVSVRINVADYRFRKSDRRILNRNRDLVPEPQTATATLEQYHLLRRYLNGRHHDGGMADMDAFDYRSMVEDSPIDTFIFEYRAQDSAPPQACGRHDTDSDSDSDTEASNPLAAACLTDVVSDGLSMVYSFFDPEHTQRSLGSYMILHHIQTARQFGLPYVYLGYWVDNCQKMQYKARFQPLEQLTEAGWQPMQPGCQTPPPPDPKACR